MTKTDANDIWREHGPDALREALDATTIIEASSFQSPDPSVSGEPPWISAADLQAKEFPPVEWVIPGILPQGVTILAGRPKLGKSWTGLDWAIAVASGDETFGVQCQQGDVLYAALEDTERRLKARMEQMGAIGPERLHFLTAMPKADEGGIDLVRSWLKQAIKPRLVIIDVLARVRSGKSSEEGNYATDYKAVSAWKALADEFGIAIVLVHHVRKMEAEDRLEMTSGTNGLTGAADTVLILNRDSQGATLSGRGRDLEEFELAVQFDPCKCRWKSLGVASDVRRSDERTKILRCLMDAGPEGLSPKELEHETGMPGTNIRQLLSKMVKAGEISKSGRGRYLYPHQGADNNDN
jgi:hypothetical protein